MSTPDANPPQPPDAAHHAVGTPPPAAAGPYGAVVRALGLDADREDALARRCYSAYGGRTNHLNYQGLPMPEFDDLGPVIRDAWCYAARIAWLTGYHNATDTTRDALLGQPVRDQP